MNKKWIWVTVLVCIIAIILLVGYALTSLFHIVKPAPGTTQSPFPSSGNVSPGGTSTATSAVTMTVPASSGAPITTKDFIHNGETAPDVENPGKYYLAGSVGYCLANGTCPSGASTTDFSISYHDSYFTITLLSEPIGAARTQAQEFLKNRLGISESDMCRLNYALNVPAYVNSTFAGQNLGFSFCPGAKPLP